MSHFLYSIPALTFSCLMGLYSAEAMNESPEDDNDLKHVVTYLPSVANTSALDDAPEDPLLDTDTNSSKEPVPTKKATKAVVTIPRKYHHLEKLRNDSVTQALIPILLTDLVAHIHQYDIVTDLVPPVSFPVTLNFITRDAASFRGRKVIDHYSATASATVLDAQGLECRLEPIRHNFQLYIQFHNSFPVSQPPELPATPPDVQQQLVRDTEMFQGGGQVFPNGQGKTSYHIGNGWVGNIDLFYSMPGYEFDKKRNLFRPVNPKNKGNTKKSSQGQKKTAKK